MLNHRTRLAGLAPACLKKAAAWTLNHSRAFELLALIIVAGLIILDVRP